MQAYRQDYCDDGSQKQMYQSSSQSYHSSGGMHHSGSAMLHSGPAVQHSSSAMQHGSGMMHKNSSMNSYSSSMTVFGQDVFCDIMPSAFPPGTDVKMVQCYNQIDKDGNGIIDDRELQAVLSNCNHSFGMRTVHLLMYEFTHSNKRMIGPKEFVPLMKCLQTWRAMFQRFDRNRNGSIDSSELGQALSCLGYQVSPVIINLLAAKFSKSGRSHTYRCSLQYDSFIECCLTVKGLSETFYAKAECGKASFCYEEFLLNVLPFIIA
ncbi:calcium-binding protein CBP-like [Amaranthus tricolor]|uniref:calcium-binding protein CBP-like n=1 Tax=Amaranthus tricolor TaxID=29722 RepID=UPI0025903CC4|nr:calcium-binding protein CBP-like [Amaranthus tricolor]